jgi:flagellar biosynthesis protein FlhF
MKITRHTAKDMRQALRLVRDQLGPDAVILTSKRTPLGVEVTAAVDFDAARIEAQTPPAATEPRTFRPEEFAPPVPQQGAPARREQDPYTIADSHEDSSYERAQDDVQQSVFARIQAEMLNATQVAPPKAVASATASATTARGRNSEVKAVQSPAPARAVKSDALYDSQETHDDRGFRNDREVRDLRAPRAAAGSRGVQVRGSEEVHSALESAIDSYMAAGGPEEDDALLSATVEAANRATSNSNTDGGGEESAMSAELKAMRRILETQMAQLAWNDLTRRAPIHTEILRELTEVGITQEFAAQIVAQLPPATDLITSRRLSISLMATQLNVTGDRWLDKGGRVALIGPTGVGKTTALAKLAVRWVLRHGARSLALISADSVRIGAHDQMQALGQMIDVPVYVAENLAEIPKLLERLGQPRFVLIDTPGMSQRDAQLTARMTQLAATGHDGGARLETALVLSASTQTGAIAETVQRFAPGNPTSVLLTKVDEAASLGGILSVLARAALPISYVSEGQRVPEDLRPARALELVSRAVQLAKSSGAAADEDLLRRRYGEVAHAFA